MELGTKLKDIFLISPLIVLFVTSLIPLGIKLIRGNRELHFLPMLFCVFTGILMSISLLLIPDFSHLAFDRTIIVDKLSRFVGVLVLFLTGGSLFLLVENKTLVEKFLSETVFLLLNASVGMLVLLWANDLLGLFVGMELMSLSLYLLIALSREKGLAKEAAFKYFLLGSLSSAIFLLGAALVFGVSGTVNLGDLSAVMGSYLDTNRLFLFGVSLLICGFAFKVSLAPFHIWTPDVYQGSATPLTAYMATAVKAVGFAALLRFFTSGAMSPTVITFLQWLAVVTMVIGNIGALVQANLKRMLAYSSIAHSGYLLIGVIVSGILPETGRAALLFYLASYAIMSFGAFAIISYLEKDHETFLHTEDLAGLYHTHPWLSLALAVCLFSLAGIPPLVGFFGKFFIFSAAIEAGLYWIALWGVISSVIGVYYYLRPVVITYMADSTGDLLPRGRVAYLTGFAIGVSVVAIVLFGIFVQPLITSVH